VLSVYTLSSLRLRPSQLSARSRAASIKAVEKFYEVRLKGVLGSTLSPGLQGVAVDRRALVPTHGDPEGLGYWTLGWVPTPPAFSVEGLRRTLKAIHAPAITSSTMPAGTVGGVLSAPIGRIM
jgi:hypothetical protein